MTVSAHVYSATLHPSTALHVRGGRITLDEAAAPHVQGSITIPVPSIGVLTALDPRQTTPPRITVAASASTPWGTQSREFNLTVRGRTVNHSAGTMTVDLASDEALLQDYAPAADDAGAYYSSASLRQVVAYVLAKIGATLAATPSTDANVRPYVTVKNLVTDPSVEGGGTIYTEGWCTLDRADTTWAAVGSKSLTLYFPTSSTGDVYASVGGDMGAVRLGMQGGRTYIAAATGRVKFAMTGVEDPRARRIAVFYKTPGDSAYTVVMSDTAVPNTVNVPTRVVARFTLPSNVSEAFVRLYHGHAGGGEISWDAVRVSEDTGDPADTDYFDGSTPGIAGLTSYAWDGAANGSTSTRTAMVQRSVDALKWKAGVNGLQFIAPLVQAAGMRLVCDENRVWTLRTQDYQAPGVTAIMHGVNLVNGTDRITRGDELWFDRCVVVYKWTDSAGTVRTAIDSYSSTPTPTRAVRIDRDDTPYPGAGFAQYAVQRAQGRGREVSATAVADWDAKAEQPIQIMLLDAPIQIGKTTRVEYDLDRDEMTVTSRTTDTPAGAIDLKTGTIDSLTGTIDSL